MCMGRADVLVKQSIAKKVWTWRPLLMAGYSSDQNPLRGWGGHAWQKKFRARRTRLGSMSMAR